MFVPLAHRPAAFPAGSTTATCCTPPYEGPLWWPSQLCLPPCSSARAASTPASRVSKARLECVAMGGRLVLAVCVASSCPAPVPPILPPGSLPTLRRRAERGRRNVFVLHVLRPHRLFHGAQPAESYPSWLAEFPVLLVSCSFPFGAALPSTLPCPAAAGARCGVCSAHGVLPRTCGTHVRCPAPRPALPCWRFTTCTTRVSSSSHVSSCTSSPRQVRLPALLLG